MNLDELPPHFRRAYLMQDPDIVPISPVSVNIARHTPISAYTWQKMLDTLNNEELQTVTEWLQPLMAPPPPPQTRLQRFTAWIQSWRS